MNRVTLYINECLVDLYIRFYIGMYVGNYRLVAFYIEECFVEVYKGKDSLFTSNQIMLFQADGIGVWSV